MSENKKEMSEMALVLAQHLAWHLERLMAINLQICRKALL